MHFVIVKKSRPFLFCDLFTFKNSAFTAAKRDAKF